METTYSPTSGIERRLRRLRDSLDHATRRRRDLPAPQVLLQAPGLRFEYGDPARPFHAASVGKLMTATLTAMLADEGRLDFATPIGMLLPAPDLADLPAAPGVDAAAEITVEHLLTHTSGLPDFFEPPRGATTACSIDGVVTKSDRRFWPCDLLDAARTVSAAGHPGQRFHYSDTGYVLLGRIIEEATGTPLHALLRERVFEPCGMEHGATPYDPAIQPDDLATLDVAPFWLGGHELSRARSVSIDWACGGIVATPDDFARFQRALHAGSLISSAFLERLIRPRNRFRRGIRYGAGTMTLRFGEFFPLLGWLPQPVGHIGVWSTHIFSYPQKDAHLVLNFHSDREMNRSFATQLRTAQIVARLKDAAG